MTQAEVLPAAFKNFIKHADTQTVLTKLKLPMIVLQQSNTMELDLDLDDNSQVQAAVPSDSIVMIVDDNDIAMDDDRDQQLPRSSSGNQPGSASSHPRSDLPLVPVQDQLQGVPVQDQLQGVVAVAPAPTHVAWAASARNSGVQQLAKMTAPDFESLPRATLVRVAGRTAKSLATQIDRNKKLKGQLQAVKRKLARATDKADKKRTKKLVTDLVSTLTLQTTGKTGKRLTCESSFSLGIRRNLSNVACNSIGAVLKVARAEVKTGAAVICSMRFTCSNLMDHCRLIAKSVDELDEAQKKTIIPRSLSLSSVKAPWSLTVVSLRSDATNSAIWKRQSLNVMEAEVLVVSDYSAVRSYHMDSAFSIKRCLHFG